MDAMTHCAVHCLLMPALLGVGIGILGAQLDAPVWLVVLAGAAAGFAWATLAGRIV